MPPADQQDERVIDLGAASDPVPPEEPAAPQPLPPTRPFARYLIAVIAGAVIAVAATLTVVGGVI